MRKRKKKQPDQKQSMIGRIVDLNLEDFKREVVDQKINVGTLKNLILNLNGAYNELKVRKDGIMSEIAEGILSKDDSEVKRVLEGLYAEMIKIEEKVTYLNEYTKKLTDVG